MVTLEASLPASLSSSEKVTSVRPPSPSIAVTVPISNWFSSAENPPGEVTTGSTSLMLLI